MFVPPRLLCRELVSLNYDDSLGRYFGFTYILALIKQKYYWPEMNKDIKSYVNTYDTCHQTKPVCHKLYGEFSALPLPRAPFIDLTIDFITGMPLSEFHGIMYDSIFIVIWCCTKFVQYIPAQMD